MSVEPYVPPEWHVTITNQWQPPVVVREPVWRRREDTVLALVTALFVGLLGPAAGLVWAALAPKLSVSSAIKGNEAAFKAQIGADVWFLFIAVAAGLITAAIAVWVFRVHGPGLLIGLVVGGAAAAVAADRVGYLVDHASTLAALRAAGVKHPTSFGVSLLDFRVRALGVLTAWPIAAAALVGLVETIDSRRR